MCKPTEPQPGTRRQHGFTLVEAIIAIALTGILAAVVAVFVARPMQGYADAARRADLSDAADTALRRIGRDIRLALPNSVRVDAGGQALEYLSTAGGGRYRVALGNGSENILDFNQNDTSFDLLGPPITFAATSLANQNLLVIYNLGFDVANAYSGSNVRVYNGAAGAQSTIQIASTAPYPLQSPGNRFHIVDTPVSYACAGGNLWRFWAYAVQTAQPGLAWLQANAQSALLAQDVQSCSFSYAPGATERSGLVEMQLAVGRDGETVSLYHQVHVINVP